VTLRTTPPRSFSITKTTGIPLGFQADQYAVLSHKTISKPRSYFLAKAPEAESPFELTFFIRYVPGGEFTTWLTACRSDGRAAHCVGPNG
jgi:ferredoxin-NADP reductase